MPIFAVGCEQDVHYYAGRLGLVEAGVRMLMRVLVFGSLRPVRTMHSRAWSRRAGSLEAVGFGKADRADARGWGTFVPSEPCTHVHGHGVQDLSRRWGSARRIGLTPEAGGPSSRPNHALTCMVTACRLS